MANLNENSMVADLKEYLEEIIEHLDWNYDDDHKLNIVSNTYFLGSCPRGFIGLEGHNGGYINLDDPVRIQRY